MNLEVDAFAAKLGAFIAMTPGEVARLESLQGSRLHIPAGTQIVQEHQRGHAAYILHEGWVCSHKLLEDGGRQVVDVQIPGDFLGLRSVLLRASDHNFDAVTDVEVSEIATGGILAAFREEPRLAAAVLWAASRDEAMVVEHLVCVGRRSALVRTAHFLVELGARLSLVGRAQMSGYACPLTQYQLADALGLSAIHLNRVLRQLREMGLLTMRERRVTFHDTERLMLVAGFDPTYLDHNGPLIR